MTGCQHYAGLAIHLGVNRMSEIFDLLGHEQIIATGE
jgi:hypothetical protein